MNIGYIGLGAMGGALATRLLSSQPLIVWDINQAAVAAFEKLGAKVAPSAAELARQCDVILLCLPRSSDVRKVIFGADGLAQGLTPGKLVIDQTSGVPSETSAMALELAQVGVHLVDAPVSGGISGVKAGTIAMMTGGTDDAFQKALPVLSAISPNVLRCGSRVGDGQAMKSLNNLLSAGARLATLEIVAMGRKMGLSLASITDVVNKGSGRNRTSKVMLPDMVAGKASSSSFAMTLMLKDINQAIQLGMDCGAPMPIANAVRVLLQIGVSTLGDGAQLEQITGVIESQARARIAEDAGSAPAKASGPAVDAKALRVGYVGLGAMGGALTRRLLLSRPVQVFDTRAEVAQALQNEGASVAANLPSLARDCDVIFVCLPTSGIVREVVFGKGGLAEGLAPGKIVVDQTTGDPAITRAIAADLQKLGVPLVDAPVSGGPRGALAGTIAVMCGGPGDAFARVESILGEISPNYVYCGQTGNGHVAKLINNSVASCNRLLTYEAAALAVRYGLKLADVATVINKSTGWSGATERILPTLSEGKATSDFQLALMVKDLKLSRRMAMDCGAPMLVANTACSLFEAGVNELGGASQLDEIARVYEAMVGIKFAGA
jgi:3-hydroxyisobutyrate dehydrogenase